MAVRLRRSVLSAAFAAALMMSGPTHAEAAKAPARYTLIDEWHLPGPTRWDMMAFDVHNRHLFVTHGDHVDIIDVDLPRPRDLDMINSDAFGTYVRRVRGHFGSRGMDA